MHRADARVKLALLVLYTVCLFLVGTWGALGLLAALLALVLAASRLPAGMLARLMIPVYVLMAFAVTFNSLTLDPEAAVAYGLGNASPGVFGQMVPVALGAGWYVLPAGFGRSLFFCVRVLAMVLASLVVAYSTPATRLTDAFAWALRPLACLRVPVDDVAFTFTLALRFIPLAFEELQQLKLVQTARHAAFDAGGLWTRMKAWGPVLVPWMVTLYRRAGRVATAMDVRAYGLAGRNARTSLNPPAMRRADWGILACGACIIAAPCVLLA